MDRQEKTEDYVSQTIDRQSEFIQLYNIKVSPQIKLYTEQLKANNIKINYCCTDSPEDIAKLLDYGVEFILVNELGDMMKVWEGLQ